MKSYNIVPNYLIQNFSLVFSDIKLIRLSALKIASTGSY